MRNVEILLGAEKQAAEDVRLQIIAELNAGILVETRAQRETGSANCRLHRYLPGQRPMARLPTRKHAKCSGWRQLRDAGYSPFKDSHQK